MRSLFTNSKPLVVLSLFDGMSCGIVALKRAGIPIKTYYSSEIDKYAIQVSTNNHPEIVRLGDVTKWREWDIDKPDLVIGGSPCQGFSFAGKQLAFDDPRSSLFFTMMDIIAHYKPRYKMLENVRMKQEYLDVITSYMGCGEPIMINSALVSAQNRKRYYWANWNIEQPEDKGIEVNDIIDRGNLSINSMGWQKWWNKNQKFQIGKKYSWYCNLQGKSICMTARQVSSWNGNLIKHHKGIRFISALEGERLQTLPDGYTAGVSNTQRYKMLGNGWTVDAISHIFRGMYA